MIKMNSTKEIEVTLEQITDWKKENVVYIDTRGAIAYQHGHIENAQVFENMDLVKEQIPLQENKKYVVYCTYGETSYEIAQELREMGYDAYNLKGGYRSWLLKHLDIAEKNYSVMTARSFCRRLEWMDN